jgi:hypothetical protein
MPIKKSNATLCQEGKVNEIPKGSLTQKDLLEKNENGIAAIIFVILNKQLHLIPKDLLTHKVFNESDLCFKSGYYIAAEKGLLHQIPEELITKDVLVQTSRSMFEANTPPIWAILIARRNIKPILPFLDDLIDQYKGPNTIPLLPTCAIHNMLTDIPQKYLTKERVFKTIGGNKQTLLHFAAMGGCLKAIPKEFLTQNSMKLTNKYGATPLHLAASHDQLDKIPKNFLTKEGLKKAESRKNLNPLQLAATYTTFQNVPRYLLNDDNLLTKFKEGNSIKGVLSILSSKYLTSFPEMASDIEKSLKELLTLLSLKGLSAFKKELEDNPVKMKEIEILVDKEIIKKSISLKFKREININIDQI